MTTSAPTVAPVKITSNNHERALYSAGEVASLYRTGALERDVLTEDFDYLLTSSEGPTDEGMQSRLFQAYGGWYDLQEFEVAPDSYKARGWDGVQAESAWNAIVVRCFDADGYELEGVVVGYATW